MPSPRRPCLSASADSPNISRRHPLSARTSAVSLAANGDHVGQQLGEVGHDAVDAQVEQAPHLGLLVDGPDVHLDSMAVRVLDQGRGHQRPSAELSGNLASGGRTESLKHLLRLRHEAESQSEKQPPSVPRK